ncbi:MAG: YbaB/EbfC family nucleoid-associated protein [Myxococcota bacterium]|nr:YbaB/EbfC family nucleoid-associated protein [Myxococcota bacterium]
MSNPFDMLGGMGGIGNLLGGFQQKMKQVQEEAAQAEFTSESGGGAIRVTVNGKHELLSLEIDEAVLDDAEMLGDLIVVAVNNAQAAAQANMQSKMAEITQGLPIPPGLLNF